MGRLVSAAGLDVSAEELGWIVVVGVLVIVAAVVSRWDE